MLPATSEIPREVERETSVKASTVMSGLRATGRSHAASQSMFLLLAEEIVEELVLD